MKSLDHWPDLGNDLDLYTTADEKRVVNIMLNRMGAHVEPRSWGDRLANKWNFAVPGLPESVEVHAQRLGQTGEHIAMARRFVTRRVPKTIQGLTFHGSCAGGANHRSDSAAHVPALLLPRLRHREHVDVASGSGQLDFAELKKAADLGGVWPGVATYLKIVCDYVREYRGDAPELPQPVLAAARFGGDVIFARGKFLRIPVLPNGAELYTRQITDTAIRGDVPATLRLSLLPYLASAAAVAFRITGSDKGIW